MSVPRWAAWSPFAMPTKPMGGDTKAQRRLTLAVPLAHQAEAVGTQTLVAELEVVADVGAAAVVVQALVGRCTRRWGRTQSGHSPPRKMGCHQVGPPASSRAPGSHRTL